MKILMHLLSTQIFDIDEKQLCRITGAATWETKTFQELPHSGN